MENSPEVQVSRESYPWFIIACDYVYENASSALSPPKIQMKLVVKSYMKSLAMSLENFQLLKNLVSTDFKKCRIFSIHITSKIIEKYLYFINTYMSLLT